MNSAAREETGSDILARICADKREQLAALKAKTSIEAIRSKAAAAGETRGFGRALKEKCARDDFALIAEIKKASPSSGLIRQDFDPVALAKAYQSAGATCLSVLTDEKHFQGSSDHLKAARKAVDLPLLRKDFILDPWQVYESRALGADCILLIMGALDDSCARELEALARSLDMDVLAEVHNAAELERALGLETNLIGINNRDLKTLQVNLHTTLELAPQIPPERFIIAESGIRSHQDLVILAQTGVRSFLVGEWLMRQPDVAEAARQLLTGPAETAPRAAAG
jgi:indole-3-glycerol phosphate synthase